MAYQDIVEQIVVAVDAGDDRAHKLAEQLELLVYRGDASVETLQKELNRYPQVVAVWGYGPDSWALCDSAGFGLPIKAVVSKTRAHKLAQDAIGYPYASLGWRWYTPVYRDLEALVDGPYTTTEAGGAPSYREAMSLRKIAVAQLALSLMYPAPDEVIQPWDGIDPDSAYGYTAYELVGKYQQKLQRQHKEAAEEAGEPEEPEWEYSPNL